MQNVFIFHGTYGNPQENWFPWLKKELEKTEYKVFIPQFPTPENQSLASWMKVISEYEGDIDDSILIGHSVGAPFALKVAERHKVKAVILVGGFCGLLGNKELDGYVKTFVDGFDWKRIKCNTGKFFIFHSDDDPYIKKELAETLATNLNTELIIVKKAGHFNEKAGYTKFPLLLEYMKKI